MQGKRRKAPTRPRVEPEQKKSYKSIRAKESPKPREVFPTREQKRTGYVYWTNSRKIDKEDMKPRRQYVVVRDNKQTVAVAKIRGKNGNPANDERLYELDMSKYPLSKPSGVDKQVYDRRGDNYQKLRLEDAEIFDKEAVFKLRSHDTYRALQHTGVNKRKGNKKGRKS